MIKVSSVLLLIGCGLIWSHTAAQSLVPFVTASTGGTGSGTWGSLSYTAGETVIVTGMNSAVKLTQGFHQPMVSDLFDLDEDEGFMVYPNPSDGVISIVTRVVIREIKLYNEIGQLIWQSFDITDEIDLGDHATGVYQLVVSTEEKVYSKTLVIN